MVDEVVVGFEFFEMLVREDEAITAQVAAAGCWACNGFSGALELIHSAAAK